MSRLLQAVLCGVGVALSLAVTGGGGASAQTLFLRGQTIQPVFEGWEKNPDGTFSMLFGYLNRNYEESPHIPVGANNSFSPGPPDRGQPTHFYPRRQSFVFRVIVPADWGTKDLVWTVNHNGRALTAYGTLTNNWSLDEGVWRANRGAGINGRMGAEMAPNARPVVTIIGAASLTAAVHEPLTLTVTATDDGKPGPRPPRPPRRPGVSGEGLTTTPTVIVPGLPTFGGNRSGAASGVGGPTDQNMVRTSLAYETGLAVTFLHYRGPGRVTFEPMAMPIKIGDQAVTKARFSEAGTYVVRAVADDSSYTSPVDITVTVKDASSQVVRR
jgi:hypothetical protein